MVWVSWGGRRVRGGGYGGRGYGGYGPNYLRGYGRGPGGGGCLRDLFLVETGCCLADALGCGPGLLLLAPSADLLVGGARPVGQSRAEALVRLYRERVRPRRRHSVCRMTPSCSTYALEALQLHGTARGLRLTAARLLRCRPGGPTGADPVPFA